MLLWASTFATLVSGFGVVNYAAMPWIGDLAAVVFVISMFATVCATGSSSGKVVLARTSCAKPRPGRDPNGVFRAGNQVSSLPTAGKETTHGQRRTTR